MIGNLPIITPIEQQNQPFSYAHCVAIMGDQGSGKSVSAATRIVEDALKHIVAIKRYDDGRVFQALPLSKDEKKLCLDKGYAISIDSVKVKTDKGWRIMQVPPRCIIIPSIHIYCNFHLYGIRYMLVNPIMVIELLENEKMRNGRLVLDEAHMIMNNRDCMSALGKILAKDSYTFRKRHLDVDIMSAHEQMIDIAIRKVITERRFCTYDPKTMKVTINISGKGYPQPKEVTYDAWPYFKYYFTDELFHAPSGQVNKAIAQAR